MENHENIYYLLSFDDEQEDFSDNFFDILDDHWFEHITLVEDLEDDEMIYCIMETLKQKYNKSRFIIRFVGAKECYNNFLLELSYKNLTPIAIVDLTKSLSDNTYHILFKSSTSLEVHIKDYEEYKEHRETMMKLINEDIIIYGEANLKAFPELLS